MQSDSTSGIDLHHADSSVDLQHAAEGTMDPSEMSTLMSFVFDNVGIQNNEVGTEKH